MSVELGESVKLSRVKKVIDHIEHDLNNVDCKERGIDPDISFEYIIGSLFPTIFQNIMNRLADEHTKGFIDGYATAKKELEDEGKVSE